jgi:hypothetical protein
MSSLSSRVNAWQLLVAVGLSIVLTVGWLAILPHAAVSGGDTVFYLRMALEPKAPAETPYAFRVLTPWLAHQLGSNRYPGYDTSFRIITASALAAAGPATYLICRKLGGTHVAALVGVAGLLSLPGWLFNLYQPYLIDPLAMALTAWCITAVAYQWTRVLPLLLTAAVLARETGSMLIVPLYLVLRRRWVDFGTAVQVLLLMGPALLAMWAVRQPQRITGWPTTAELVVAGWNAIVDQRLTSNPAFWVTYAFAASLGIWWVFGWYGRRAAGRLMWFLVPVFVVFLIGTDWSRYALYAFPVVVPAGVIAVWRHPARTILLALIGAQSLVALVDIADNGRLTIDQARPSVWVTLGLAVCAIVVWHLPLARWRRRTDNEPVTDRPADDQPGDDQPVEPPAGRDDQSFVAADRGDADIQSPQGASSGSG